MVLFYSNFRGQLDLFSKFLLLSKIVAKTTIYDHHDHGRFQARFDLRGRGRQMVVMVAGPPN